MKNLPNLYPLRFFLSVMVIIYHLPLICKTLNIPYYNAIPIFEKGTLAVYYFFSLSGFLILRLIYNEFTATQNFNFKNFFLRRIQRLYPVYYLVLFIGITVYFFILPRIGISAKANYSLSELLFYYVFFIPNVFRYKYPNTGSILIVLWSIGVEEQFYLLIPAFMFAFKKKIAVAVSLLLVLLLLVLLFIPPFYKYFNYFFYFVFGGLLSILACKKKVNVLKHKFVHLLVYSLAIISFTTNLLNFQNPFFFHIATMLISGLLITLLSDYPIFVIQNKLLDYLGKISYGIYAYQMIVITFVIFLVGRYKPYNFINTTSFIIVLNLLVIALVIGVAHLSYKYFESRFYKSKH